MHRRAAPMQIVLAVVGTICAAVMWSSGGGVLWLLGALLAVGISRPNDARGD